MPDLDAKDLPCLFELEDYQREMLGPKADAVMSMKTERRLIDAGELSVSR